MSAALELKLEISQPREFLTEGGNEFSFSRNDRADRTFRVASREVREETGYSILAIIFGNLIFGRFVAYGSNKKIERSILSMRNITRALTIFLIFQNRISESEKRKAVFGDNRKCCRGRYCNACNAAEHRFKRLKK